MLGLHLTSKEKILVHLLEYVGHAEAVEVPVGMTQQGISRSTGIDLPHVSQYAQPLIRDGLVRERVTHVKGARRRRKVYDITDPGRLYAIKLRRRLLSEVVRVRETSGIGEKTVQDVLAAAPGTPTVLDLVLETERTGFVDLAVLTEGTPDHKVAMLTQLPQLAQFVGRQDELECVARDGGEARLFVVRGVAGIGKTSFAAKVCERLQGAWNLLYHRMRAWDTRESILSVLAEFLLRLGRPGLRSLLRRGEVSRADEVLRESISGSRSFLIMDDAHEAGPEVIAFLRFLKDCVESATQVRMMVLTRRAIPIYDRRDVSVSGLVEEIDLAGLGDNDVVELLSGEANAGDLLPVARRLGGHPLFLDLLRSSRSSEIRRSALRTIRLFIEEEIYGRLDSPERRMMKVASLYEVPVPRESFFIDEQTGHDVLVSLEQRALIRPMGDDVYAAHDTVQDFFLSVLTPAEKESLGRFAVDQLRRVASVAHVEGNPARSIQCLSNALRLAADPRERTRLWESLGDANEVAGNLPDSLGAYEMAADSGPCAEDLARIHRKVACAWQVRGNVEVASAELDSGQKALGDLVNVEIGWLDLIRCRVATMLEEWEEAREHGNRSLRTFRTYSESSGASQALLELGRIEIDAPAGCPVLAREHLEDALSLVSAEGGEPFRARAHFEMARLLAYRLAKPEEASKHIATAASFVDNARDPHLARSIKGLGGWLTLEFRADFSAAEREFAEVIAMARRAYSTQAVAFARFGIGNVRLFKGQADEARREFLSLAEEFDTLGYPNFVIESWWKTLECSMWLDDKPGFFAALSHLRDPDLQHALESRPFRSATLRGLEQLLRAEHEGAIETLQEAVQSSESMHAVNQTSPVHFCEFYLAVLLASQGRSKEARSHLRRCEGLLKEHGYRAQLYLLPEASRRFAQFLRTVPTPAQSGATLPTQSPPST